MDPSLSGIQNKKSKINRGDTQEFKPAGLYVTEILVELGHAYNQIKDSLRIIEMYQDTIDSGDPYDVEALMDFLMDTLNKKSRQNIKNLRRRNEATLRGIESRVSMPETLTAENGSKALLMGEFVETVSREENGEEYNEDIPVSWTTIKAIYKKLVEYHAK